MGTEQTGLIVLSGNSALGKSGVAADIRDRDRPRAANIGLIDTVARYAPDAGYYVPDRGGLLATTYRAGNPSCH